MELYLNFTKVKSVEKNILCVTEVFCGSTCLMMEERVNSGISFFPKGT